MHLPPTEKLTQTIANNQTKFLIIVLAAMGLLILDKFLLLTIARGLPLKLMIFGLWLGAVFLFRLRGSASLWAGWVCLLLELIFKIFIPNPFLLEQTALFAFYFFLLGVTQLTIKELLKERSGNRED